MVKKTLNRLRKLSKCFLMISATNYVKQILSRPTKRDKQRKVGGSNISNGCTRCLADDLLGNNREQGVYNMGAIVGTAIHAYLEERNLEENALLEYKVGLGYIPGYGKITSRLDLYRPDHKQVVDFKTTTRDKMERYKRLVEENPPADMDTDLLASARATLEQYIRQATLYAWSLAQDGFPVETVAIVFVCRDGQIVDRDVWGFEIPYQEHIAVAAWNRVLRLWEWLENPAHDVNTLPSHDECYYCNEVRPFVQDETRKVKL